jgi:hypothetical protein
MKCDFSKCIPVTPKVGDRIRFSHRSRKTFTISEVNEIAFNIGKIGNGDWHSLSELVYDAYQCDFTREAHRKAVYYPEKTQRVKTMLGSGGQHTLEEISKQTGLELDSANIILGRLRVQRFVRCIKTPDKWEWIPPQSETTVDGEGL